MNYIDLLKEQNITFKNLNEDNAFLIIKNEFSYYRLMEYSKLFEKYIKTEKKGQFISLDFCQLYYLALIDSKLCKLLLNMCLEIENYIKTFVIFELERIGVSKSIIYEYYIEDKDFLDKRYNYDIIENLNDLGLNNLNNKITSLSELNLYDFINIIYFGTLERMIYFINKNISNVNFSFEKELSSVRRIRNLSAHNNTIISKLQYICDKPNLRLCTILGTNGIKNRTLKTNMSKQIVNDISTVFQLYFTLVNNNSLIKYIDKFDIDYCQRYKTFFSNNYSIKSAYSFLKSVIIIFNKKY